MFMTFIMTTSATYHPYLVLYHAKCNNDLPSHLLIQAGMVHVDISYADFRNEKTLQTKIGILEFYPAYCYIR